MGLFYRTVRMVDNGIKPVYVFDGKPPQLKKQELEKRLERRTEAEKEREEAEELGNVENIDKFSRRTVKVTREHNAECQKLLKLMGIPYVVAPGEAEAQCAVLAAAGKVFAAGSEDMDTLTFGSPILLRHLTFSEARKMPISEVHLAKVLEGLELSHEEFIDLCILLGCDYCGTIRGVGPTTALKLIKKYRSLEKILEAPEMEKYTLPVDYNFKEARELFKKPDVMPASDINLKWTEPDVEGLVQFLVREKNFSEERVRATAQKLIKGAQQATQGRLDSFFKAAPNGVTKKRPVSDAKPNGKQPSKNKRAKS